MDGQIIDRQKDGDKQTVKGTDGPTERPTDRQRMILHRYLENQNRQSNEDKYYYSKTFKVQIDIIIIIVIIIIIIIIIITIIIFFFFINYYFVSVLMEK